MLYDWLIGNQPARSTKPAKEPQLPDNSGPSSKLCALTFRTSQTQNSKRTSIHGHCI